MKLPVVMKVRVDPAKVRCYLLSASHPVGRYKAVFFRSLGCSAVNWMQLAQNLAELAASREATVRETEYGEKYEVRGTLKGPNGRSAEIVTVWFVPSGSDVARLVTAYPRAKK